MAIKFSQQYEAQAFPPASPVFDGRRERFSQRAERNRCEEEAMQRERKLQEDGATNQCLDNQGADCYRSIQYVCKITSGGATFWSFLFLLVFLFLFLSLLFFFFFFFFFFFVFFFFFFLLLLLLLLFLLWWCWCWCFPCCWWKRMMLMMPLFSSLARGCYCCWKKFGTTLNIL